MASTMSSLSWMQMLHDTYACSGHSLLVLLVSVGQPAGSTLKLQAETPKKIYRV